MPNNTLTKYYQENKERIQKKLVKNTKAFLKKKKEKKQEYGERYKNLLEYEKQKLVVYRKK